MTLRQLIYRLYLKSPGWQWTKKRYKLDNCERCAKARTRKNPLDLHHDSYDWHNSHPFLRWIIPNTVDPMRTLCRRCHGKERK